MTRLAVNAVNVAPGGSLTVVLGLLGGFRKIGAELDVTVLTGRPVVADALREQGWGHAVRETGVASAPRARLWERFKLPRILAELNCDLLLTNNWFVWNAPCPQIVHHQTLWALFSTTLWPYARRGIRSLSQAILARKALARAEANVFISGHMRDCAEAICPDSASRNHVIYNGLSEEFLQAAQVCDPPQRSPGLICALQSPAEHKDNESLLLFLVTLRKLAPEVDWRLRIAGAGDWKRWMRRAASLGLSRQVEFPGYLKQAEVVRLLGESTCLVYPSLLEGFGMPLIEAMTCGCPVVAVSATAIPEIAGDAAMLVPPRSPRAIADAVLSISADQTLQKRLAKAGRERARRFSWADSAEALYRLCEALKC